MRLASRCPRHCRLEAPSFAEAPSAGCRFVDGDRRHLDGRHRAAGGNGGKAGDRIRGQQRDLADGRDRLCPVPPALCAVRCPGRGPAEIRGGRRLGERFNADRLPAVFRDVLGEHGEHGLGLVDHVLVPGGEALDEVLRQGEFGGERCTPQQVGVGHVAPGGGVVPQHGVHEVLVVGRDEPGHVVGRVADAQIGPAGHGRDAVAVDQQVVLVEVPVDHAGVEAPQGDVLEGVFPAAEQQRRNLAGGRGLVQFVEAALAELVGRVAGQIGVADQRVGQVMDGGEGRADFAGNGGGRGAEFLDGPGGAGQVGVHERAQRSLPHGAGNGGHQEGEFGPDAGDEGAQHQEFRFQPGAGLGVARRADAPALAFGIQEEGRVEVCRIVGRRANGGRGQSGDCRGCHSCQFDWFSSHSSTVD